MARDLSLLRGMRAWPYSRSDIEAPEAQNMVADRRHLMMPDRTAAQAAGNPHACPSNLTALDWPFRCLALPL
jgi:hypothetical protein